MKLWSTLIGSKLFRLEFLTAVIGAGISIVLARLWGPSIQGTWSILNNFTSTLVILLTAGLPAIILAKLRRSELHQSKIWNQTILYAITVGIALLLILFVTKDIWDISFLASELIYASGGPILITIQIVCMILVNILAAWMDGNNKLAEVSRLRLWLTVAWACCIAALFFFYQHRPEKFIYVVWYGLIIQSLIMILVMIYSIPNRQIHDNKVTTPQSVVRFIYESGWIFVLADLFQKLNYKADIWFLSAFSTNDQVGIYSIASALSLFILIRPRNAQRVLINTFKVDAQKENHILIVAEIKTLVKDTFLILVVFIAGSYLLFRYILGPEYLLGFPISVVLLIGAYMISITMPYSAYFVYLQKPTYNGIAATIGLVTNIVLNSIWAPRYGIWGVTWASLCTYCAITLALYLLFHRHQALHSHV